MFHCTVYCSAHESAERDRGAPKEAVIGYTLVVSEEACSALFTAHKRNTIMTYTRGAVVGDIAVMSGECGESNGLVGGVGAKYKLCENNRRTSVLRIAVKVFVRLDERHRLHICSATRHVRRTSAPPARSIIKRRPQLSSKGGGTHQQQGIGL